MCAFIIQYQNNTKYYNCLYFNECHHKMKSNLNQASDKLFIRNHILPGYGDNILHHNYKNAISKPSKTLVIFFFLNGHYRGTVGGG